MQVAEPISKIQNPAREENVLLVKCQRFFESNTLLLPTIPEVAFKIRRAVNDETANNNKIARIVQLDPSITARLIKLSNSPMYRGRKTVESCPEALTRIGLNSAQNIVTAMALKAVFTAKHPLIRQMMIDLWAHSSYVSAISAVLAQQAGGFDPDRAMLAGLIHDIGKVPILIFADRHGGENFNPVHLDEVIEKLHRPIGLKMLNNWAFPADFKDVIQHSENWDRDTGLPADYADIVMLAQLHSLIGKVDVKQLPKIGTLPVLRKIITDIDPNSSRSIIDDAREEIELIRQMLQ